MLTKTHLLTEDGSDLFQISKFGTTENAFHHILAEYVAIISGINRFENRDDYPFFMRRNTHFDFGLGILDFGLVFVTAYDSRLLRAIEIYARERI